ncbi:4-hydroxybenzoate polyprenyl transferase [Coprinopsis cinerea okayama7|uniref:4-hydroxybenzoate polyprenyl transferase n=1 Tax=Coprinopsis cinerea (strain Okayama-7 / 130 / ATCC MYA-4618 / FGSC 9003) TaxID=240176 RepID=A8P7Q5_COPC7|nr:4-hydroxybenzoate polyprenyl transferase [Coprinopsis cinerea okayama7\|eukprot:XP_001839411.2 4-hydroxybenzoate polyprenyl transferase [Coprinopsis cinerea okayama7\
MSTRLSQKTKVLSGGSSLYEYPFSPLYSPFRRCDMTINDLDKTIPNELPHSDYGAIATPTTPKSKQAIIYLCYDITPWVQLTRIQKYGGALLLFWPFAWSLTIAATALKLPLPTYLVYLGYSFVFANLLRSAGCIWNDILDRDLDRQVGLYPLMKRITYWPQAWLGLAMNAGVPLTWASLTGQCSSPDLVFFAGTWAWCIWYDTIYACQDKKDDVSAGIKSTAVLFDQYTKAILVFFGILTFGCFSAAGYLNGASYPYYFVTILGGITHFVWQLRGVNLDNPKSCWKMFASNAYSFGYIMWGGILIEYLMSVFL